MQQATVRLLLHRVGLVRRTACFAAVSLAALSWSFGAPKAAEKPAGASKWTSLFDGKTIGQWKLVDKFDFNRHGKVYVKDGSIILEEGSSATGIRWSGKFPKMDYETAFEAKRVKGSDFFCGATFPVGDTALTLILGGWGGSVVGLSNIDGFRAADNETCQAADFENNRWYRVRVKVTKPKAEVAKPKIEVWLDDKQLIELSREARTLAVDWVMEPCLPLGFATWDTTGAIRNIRYRLVGDEPSGADRPKP